MKLSVIKAIMDSFLYLAVFGMLTNIIGKEFYGLSAVFILGGFFVNLSYIIKQLVKR